MTPNLSIPNRCFDIPPVRIAPMPQAERDAALVAMWQASRGLPMAAREAVLARYAPPSVLSGSTGAASEAGEARHLRQVVGSEGSSRSSRD
ncbi:hypothetical protein Rpal_0643 [Rhodopseudomonas palustris TIE-1]|uniref:hypothetical protein n=1 Tax=Rhodopseudomonas palustris TaxID=1076 RepID=UPI00017795C8|nr:hypothetical protein [Rhodopseudomonas palustris]ACE99202.1 hypothetical protein Rpal_0643 [Rhodopseudomonas palustris TIE-1]